MRKLYTHDAYNVNVDCVNVLCVNAVMNDSPEAITAAVRDLAKRADLNMTQFAKRLGYKTTSGVQRYFSPDAYKGGYLSTDLIGRMIEGLVGLGEPAITADDIRILAGPAFTTPLPATAQTFAPSIIPGRELVGDRNFPVFAAARGGSEGHQIVSFEAIDYVKRPSILDQVKDAYGLYIVGESMVPAFEPGDMALVHPHLPPARDKNVVLYHVPPTTGAEAEAMVKRLVRHDDRDWHLRQFNPPEGMERDFTVPRADWAYCHRIVGKYEAR